MSPSVLFERSGDLFLPTELAGSPWQPGVLHGGAPAGLLAACLEQSVADPRLQPARFTLDLIRPVPRAPLAVQRRRLRAGKRIVLEEARLEADGKTVAIATGLFVATQPVTVPAYAPVSARLEPGPEQLREVSFRDVLFAKNPDMPPGLHTTIRLRPVSALQESGRGTAWLAIPVPILQGSDNSPFMRAALMSDFSNGVGQLSLGGGAGIINADISLHLQRLPQGEWIALDATTRLHAGGVALVTCDLYDTQGCIGQVMQSAMPMTALQG